MTDPDRIDLWNRIGLQIEKSEHAQEIFGELVKHTMITMAAYDGTALMLDLAKELSDELSDRDGADSYQ